MWDGYEYRSPRVGKKWGQIPHPPRLPPASCCALVINVNSSFIIPEVVRILALPCHINNPRSMYPLAPTSAAPLPPCPCHPHKHIQRSHRVLGLVLEQLSEHRDCSRVLTLAQAKGDIMPEKLRWIIQGCRGRHSTQQTMHLL